MKRKYLRLFYFVLVVSLFSCNKEVKKAGKTLRASEMGFDYFKSKAKIKLSSNGESIAASMNLRIHDGEIIWMSVSKYGKEAMRVKVSPDSAHFLNKYPVAERYYKVFPTQEYLKKAGMDLDFKAVQNLLFGVHPLKLEKKDSVVVSDSVIIIKQVRKGVKIHSEVDLFTSKLNEIMIVSKADTVNLSYKAYKEIDNNLIPTTFEMYVSNIQEEKRVVTNALINLTSPKFSVDATSFSFKVPTGYEKR